MERESEFEMQGLLDLILFNTEVRTGEQASGVKQSTSANTIRAMRRSWLCKSCKDFIGSNNGYRHSRIYC